MNLNLLINSGSAAQGLCKCKCKGERKQVGLHTGWTNSLYGLLLCVGLSEAQCLTDPVHGWTWHCSHSGGDF